LRLRFGLTREADKAGDRVEVELPVRPDRVPVRQSQLIDLANGQTIDLPAPAGSIRAGTFSRNVTLAADPVLVRLLAGLSYLVEYPYGCTEQRISLASSALVFRDFKPLLAAAHLDARVSSDVRNTVQAIDQAVDGDGLVAFWPHGRGNVSLTAWSYRFIKQAERAGEPIDQPLADRLATVLKQSLRSDYARLLTGSEIRERVEALIALSDGGQLDEAYAAELRRRVDVMPTTSLAQMIAVTARQSGDDRRALRALTETLWPRFKILSRDGKLYYAGQTQDGGDPIILPSETRSLAEALSAVTLAAPEDARVAPLREALLRLGEGDGWGSTNADAAALRALADQWKKPRDPLSVTLQGAGGAGEPITLDAALPVAQKQMSQPEALSLVNNNAASPVAALVETRFEPAEPGYKARRVEQGFVVTRQALRFVKDGAPLEKLAPEADGTIRLKVGDVIEEVVELVNPEDRTHVAIKLPLAAGLEPLNPNLATAPAEAIPSAPPTLPPTFVSFNDDRVLYAYDQLPKGNYRFLFRTRALIPGTFTQPPGEAETMYRKGVYGASDGQRISISR
jgi:uncharacterized protein YfaS (alpha-2-macroglobulin family)